jgi:hypothetical protein
MRTSFFGVVRGGSLTKVFQIFNLSSILPAVLGDAQMNTFDTLTDGMVTFQEFCTGYEWISGTFDSDDYFEVMMHTAWPILNH